MKKGNSIPVLFLVAAILLVGFVFYKFIKLYESKWQETYLMDDKEPYGGHVIAEVLKNYFDSTELSIVKKPLRYILDTTATNNNYIFVGNYPHLDYKDQLFLLSFVKNGNNAFIAAHDFNYNFLNHLLNPETPFFDENNIEIDTNFISENELQWPDSASNANPHENIDSIAYIQDSSLAIQDDSVYKVQGLNDTNTITSDKIDHADSSFENSFLPDSIPVENDLLVKHFQDSMVQCNFIQPISQEINSFPYVYVYDQDSALYNWQYFDTNFVNKATTTCQSIGKLKTDKINYIRIAYGKGRFYLHSNPIVFANFNLLTENHINYAELVFSQLPNSKTFYDEYSKVYKGSNDGSDGSESPLKYIFSQPELKWAYYLIVAMLLLFIFFRAKRKQKIIPILKSNSNTSLEYVQTIGSLYFQSGEHKKIAIQKMKVFLADIRTKYKVQTTDFNESFYAQLSIKSKVSIGIIKEIFERYKFLENLSTADEQILIDFYQSIETFYKNRS